MTSPSPKLNSRYAELAMVSGPPLSSDPESLDNRTVGQFCHSQANKAMAQIVSKIDIRSKEFADNRAAMRPLVDDLRLTLQRNAAGGSAAARNKHTQAGKLLARERT